MNFKFGGKGGKELRDNELSDDSVGDDDVVAMIYESIAEGSTLVLSLMKPIANEGVLVKEHDCRVCVGDSQSMSFEAAEDNTSPPFYFLNSPWYNRTDLDEKNEQKKMTSGKLKTVLGYARQAKGTRQILWDRGLWGD